MVAFVEDDDEWTKHLVQDCERPKLCCQHYCFSVQNSEANYFDPLRRQVDRLEGDFQQKVTDLHCRCLVGRPHTLRQSPILGFPWNDALL